MVSWSPASEDTSVRVPTRPPPPTSADCPSDFEWILSSTEETGFPLPREWKSWKLQGAVFAPTRFPLVRLSVQDLVADRILDKEFWGC